MISAEGDILLAIRDGNWKVTERGDGRATDGRDG